MQATNNDNGTDTDIRQTSEPQDPVVFQQDGNTLQLGQFRQYQTNLLYKQIQTELLVSLVLTASVCAVFLGKAPLALLLGWTTAVIVLVGLRSLFIYRRVDEFRPDEIIVWGESYTTSVVLSGICWGALGVIAFIYGGTSLQSFTLLVLGCISLTAYIAMQSSPQAIAAFVLPALVPTIALSFIESGVVTYSQGIVALVITGLMITSSRTLRDLLAKSFSLSSHNTELIQKLIAARETAEKAKRYAEDINVKLQHEIRERKSAEKQIQASRQRLSAILNNMQDMIYQIDEEGTIIWATPSVRDMLGYSLDEVRTKNIRDFYADEQDFNHFRQALYRHNGALHNHVSQWVDREGNRIWVSENAHFNLDSNREVVGIEGSVRDITELQEVRDSLFEEKENAQVTLASIGDGVIRTNMDGYIEYMNAAAEKVVGLGLEDSHGKPLMEVFNIVDEKTLRRPPDPVRLSIEEGKGIMLPGYLQVIHPYHNTRISVEVLASPIRDSNDDITGVVVVFHDVSELRSLSKMTYQATHDSLTGLINRREFERRVNHALEHARNGDGRYVLCYLDLDNFKVVNDTSGHIAGDELLKMLKIRFLSVIRESDSLGRLGGDEFGILFSGCSLEWAVQVAEKIRAIVEEFRFVWDSKAFRIGVSIGVVRINADSGVISDILSAADSACYMAKDKGRNRVHVYEENDMELIERQGQMQWVQKIHDVLEQNRFRLFFQVIEKLDNTGDDNGKLHGEVLVRVLDEDLDLIGPSSFIPSAERYNLMPMIDRWVVENTLAMLASNIDLVTSKLERCCINLSGQSLSDERFMRFLVDQINAARVPPDLLCFEITETAVIANLNTAANLISALRDMGCRFALDDFGVGLSSFGYLRNLAVDYLKLDGSFVKNMVNNRTDYEMVRAVNQIGHTMNIRTIAEFVQDHATLQAIRELGVDYAQGYIIARPEPMEIALFSEDGDSNTALRELPTSTVDAGAPGS